MLCPIQLDQLTDRRYLVDTGASFSLIPHRSNAPPAREPRLIGPNGSRIRCWGEERRRLRFSGREFEWSFLQADVSFPILGVDFLRSNKLLVDVASNTLVDSATGDTLALTRRPSGYTATVMLPAPGGVRATPQRTYADVAGSTPSRSSPRPAAAAEAASRVNPPMPTTIPAILDLFQDVLNPGKELPQTSCDVAHFLSTKGPPIASAFRRLDPEKLQAAQQESIT